MAREEDAIMPFDQLASPEYGNLRKIDHVIDLLSSPAQWCKGTDRNEAGQYCIRGAMIAAGAFAALEPIVMRSIRGSAGRRFRRIEEFNDDPNTTHSNVLRVLNRAREHIFPGKDAIAYTPSVRKPGTRCISGNWITRLMARYIG
jgi:hypothetical protein